MGDAAYATFSSWVGFGVTHKRDRQLFGCIGPPLAPGECVKKLFVTVDTTGAKICVEYPVDTTTRTKPSVEAIYCFAVVRVPSDSSTS